MRARKTVPTRHAEIRTVAQGLQKWLDVCEKEGRDGHDPVTLFTLNDYQCRRDHILKYEWTKDLHELVPPDVVEFRGWLLRNFSHIAARKMLSSFHSMVLELVRRGLLSHDVAAGVTIRSSSRYEEPNGVRGETYLQPLTGLQIPRIRRSKELGSVIDPCYLAADSGMRPQEYIVLPQFNLTDDGVKVDRALEKGGTKISVTKRQPGDATWS